MNIKKEAVIDQFLENHNMDYLFCILSEKEANRLSILPDSVKKAFDEKITTIALKHTALNDIPDYIIEEIEAPKKVVEDDDDFDYEEEYEDDYISKIESPFTDNYIDEELED